MKHIRYTTEVRIPEDTAVSLGKFDGIHRGHMRLMESLKQKQETGLKTAVFSFDLSAGKKPDEGSGGRLLTTNAEKAQMFGRLGVDYLLECPLSPDIMRMEPKDFVELIATRLHVKSFSVGEDFCFGRNRSGDCRLLLSLAGQYGYEVDIAGKAQENGRDISSSLIRKEISAGRIEPANHLLGYCYFVQGKVVHGNEIGRRLQIPTANLIPAKEKLLPPYGVYVTRTSICGRPQEYFGGITNVGCKPTIEGEHPAGVETHLFDFDGQIYGADIKVEFLARLRPEKKFASVEELGEQMHRDKENGRNYYKNVTKLC